MLKGYVIYTSNLQNIAKATIERKDSKIVFTVELIEKGVVKSIQTEQLELYQIEELTK